MGLAAVVLVGCDTGTAEVAGSSGTEVGAGVEDVGVGVGMEVGVSDSLDSEASGLGMTGRGGASSGLTPSMPTSSVSNTVPAR